MKFGVAAKKVISQVVDKILSLYLTIGIKKIDTRTLYWAELLDEDTLMMQRYIRSNIR